MLKGLPGVVWRAGGWREGKQGWECSSGEQGWEAAAPEPRGDQPGWGCCWGGVFCFLGTAGTQTLPQCVGSRVLLWPGFVECVCCLECECSVLALSWFVFFKLNNNIERLFIFSLSTCFSVLGAVSDPLLLQAVGIPPCCPQGWGYFGPGAPIPG